jgi:hypothetical protein
MSTGFTGMSTGSMGWPGMGWPGIVPEVLGMEPVFTGVGESTGPG